MQSLEDIVADLTSGDTTRAESSALIFGRLDLADSLPTLQLLLDHSDSETRWWAARALAELPAEAAADLVAKALHDDNDAVRQCAALVARERPSKAAVKALVKLLSDQNRLLARLAADALIACGDDATLELIDVLETQGGAAQVEAARALAHIGDTRSIGPLFRALETESTMVEHWANEGLDRMGLGMRFFSPES
jgi:HEAT repeat protein